MRSPDDRNPLLCCSSVPPFAACTAGLCDAPQAGEYALKLQHGVLCKKLPSVEIRLLCMLLVV